MAHVAPIAPFEKTENSTLNHFILFRRRFECYAGYNNVNVNVLTNGHQVNAKRLLFMYGGDWIGNKLLGMDVENKTYVEVMNELEAEFRDRNGRFNQMEFILCKPMANEALRDYIARLKPIAKMANMDNDDSYLQRIIQYYPDEQVRTKAIEANMTIENLIAWQSTRERCESLLASTATSSVNRIENRRPNNNYSNNYNYKGNDNNRFSNQSWAQASSRHARQAITCVLIVGLKVFTIVMVVKQPIKSVTSVKTKDIFKRFAQLAIGTVHVVILEMVFYLDAM